ncbi:unnamed protein product [Absidia cylindrospora]
MARKSLVPLVSKGIGQHIVNTKIGPWWKSSKRGDRKLNKKCRELRLVRQLHVKCNCDNDKQLKRNQSTFSSNNEQEARMIKKFVMDLSNSNLRAIAPRPKEFQQQQHQLPILGSDLSSTSPDVSPSSSSSSPPSSPSQPQPQLSPLQNPSYPSLSSSSSPPQLSSPPQCSSYSTSPPQPQPQPHYSSYSTSSIVDSSSMLSVAATPSLSTTSMCRCRPGNSCGCKHSGSGTGSCCGSKSSSSSLPQPSILASTSSAASSSCCGSSSQTSASSCCGPVPQAPTSSCCGSTSQAPIAIPAPSSCCQSSSSTSTTTSSLPSIRQLDSEVRTHTTKSTSCCGSATDSMPVTTLPPPPSSSIGTTFYDAATPRDSNSTATRAPASSPQSMLHPSAAHLSLAGERTGTMCEDGIGKSSCCSSKQRNSLGEIIRVVTCRCGDDCACIGCDAHPSRAMKSSQQDPYAGYTADLSMMMMGRRRRLSIAAICSTPSSPATLSNSSSSTSTAEKNNGQSSTSSSPSSSSSSSSSLPPPPQQQQQLSKYDALNKTASTKMNNDIPTSVLGEDGILLCGCGCSNTLDECTDCFQELCQDYYSGL